MAGLLRFHRWELRTYIGTIHAGTAIRLVRVIAGLWRDRQRFHALGIKARLREEVDLERTTKEFFVAQKLQKLMIVLGTASDEIDGFTAGSTVLDVLAAVEEAALVFLRPDVVQLGDQFLPIVILFCLGDIDE